MLMKMFFHLFIVVCIAHQLTLGLSLALRFGPIIDGGYCKQKGEAA
jgi:hypothetical protein